MVSAFKTPKTVVHKISPEQIHKPRMIDIGTMSCYFTFDDLTYIRKALDRSRDGLVNTIFGENMPDLVEYEELETRVAGYIHQYERRMKDAN